jgi:hypothetical protein
VCDFVIVVNMCCLELYIMYSNPKNKYGVEQFKVFWDLHGNNNDQLLKLSKCSVHMLPYFLSGNSSDGSLAKN